MADYPLDSLGVQIKDHWKEHRPRMYRELEQAGQLDQAVYLAQERTRDAFADLVGAKAPTSREENSAYGSRSCRRASYSACWRLGGR